MAATAGGCCGWEEGNAGSVAVDEDEVVAAATAAARASGCVAGCDATWCWTGWAALVSPPAAAAAAGALMCDDETGGGEDRRRFLAVVLAVGGGGGERAGLADVLASPGAVVPPVSTSDHPRRDGDAALVLDRISQG